MGISVQELSGIPHADRGSSLDTPSPPPARSYVPYLLFSLCAALYILPFLRVIFVGGDEGTILTDAVKVLHGQVFARDFFEVIGPGSIYILAGFFKIFGATFAAERIYLFATSLGTFLSMYFLSRRICGRYGILPPIVLVGVYFGMLWPMVNHHIDSNFFGLLSVVCVILWQDTRRRGLLFTAGVLAAVTTCILQPKGMLLLLAFLGWLWIQHRRQSAPISAIGIVLAGYCGTIATVALYFWSQGALRDLLLMNYVWPSQHYETLNAIAYARGISQYWTHWAIPIHGVRWFLFPLAAILILPFLLVVALPVLVVALGVPQGKKNLRPDVLLYWLCGWAFWLSEIHRRDIAHLVVGAPILIVLCVYFLVEYKGKIFKGALQILAIGAGALAIVNLFIVLCAHSVPTRVGRVGMFKPDPTLAFLDTHVAPGTRIFVYPACPMYYFLSRTTNPTRYSLLMYNYNTPSQFRDAIHDLDHHKVKYVVWDTAFEAKAGHYFSAAMYRPTGGLLMEPYLESHYRVVKDVNGTLIMERKADDNVPRR